MMHDLDEKYSSSLGLFNGRAGLVLFYFLLGIKDTSLRYRRHMIRHIRYICDNIYSVEDFSFSKGLLGVACLLGYIKMYFHLEKRVDDVLFQIDDIVYKISMRIQNRVSNFCIEDGDIGCFLYLYLRLRDPKINLSMYQILTLKECSIYLISKMLYELNSFSVLDNKSLIQCYIVAYKYKQLNIQDKLVDSFCEALKQKMNNVSLKFQKRNKESTLMNSCITEINKLDMCGYMTYFLF